MEVTVAQGTLLGLQQKTQLSKKTFFSFLGVPYAKPPTDDLRFKPPAEHPGWSGKLEAFSERNPCLQYSFMTNEIEGSEDCLYLNIFVPQEKRDEKKAVMVYIHGGAFVVGSGSVSQYSPDYLLDENVIVVVINYRLNVFGFLNLDIEECPGNVGLKDQRFAIKWVKENISAFGGDAGNITIFGESAGAASVHAHTLSPQSTGLFQKAIMQSGCMLNSWAMNEKHREAASRLAKHLGCEKNDPKETLRCLKTVPALDLLKFSNLKDETDFLEYPFIPSVESDAITDPFLPAHPEVLKKSATPVPIITGLTDLEGLIGLNKERMQQLGDFRTSKSIRRVLRGSYSEENVAQIMNFYFNERNLKSEKTRFENIVHFQSDIYFVKDFHRGFEHLINQNVTPVYNYEFKFDGEINFVKNSMSRTQLQSDLLAVHLKGACHADDLSYLFYSKMSGLPPPKPDSPELRMCKTLSKLWSNFAKNGDPNSPDLSFEWKNTSKDNPKYLSIDGDNTKMVVGLLYGSRVKLWENISNVVCTN